MSFGKRDKSPVITLQEALALRAGGLAGNLGAINGSAFVDGVGLVKVSIPRSAWQTVSTGVDRYRLIKAVIDFVDAMSRDGLFRRSELPPRALQAMHVEQYRAQVKNGGHGVFIRNNGGSGRPDMLADIRLGLSGMGARDNLMIFERMLAWMEENPDALEASAPLEDWQAAPLDKLDSDFFAADRLAPLDDLSARWISNWQELSVVEDGDYAEALKSAAELNPKLAARLVRRSIDSLGQQFSDPVQLAMAMACEAAGELKYAVGGGFFHQAGGRESMCFSLRTDKALRFCLLDDDHASMHERIEGYGPQMPEVSDIEWLRPVVESGRLPDQKKPQIGRRLSTVGADAVGIMSELAKSLNVASAADIALRKARIDPSSAIVTSAAIDTHSTGPILRSSIMVDQRGYHLITTAAGAVLMNADAYETLARLSPDEIANHERQALA